MRKFFYLVGILSLSFTQVKGQQSNLSNSTTPIPLDQPPVDGYYVKSDILDRKVVEYAPINPADVAYVKRVWLEFDLREKTNNIYASPNKGLMSVLLEAVLAGELTAYDPTPTPEDPTGDSFKTILPVDQILTRLGSDSTLVEQYDEYGNVVSSHFEASTFDPNSVVRFRIKEDWIFDKRRSVFEPRIIGIAPLIMPKGSEFAQGGVDEFGIPLRDGAEGGMGMDVDPFPAFWIYFPEARHVLVNKEVTYRYNDATGLSYDDMFLQRRFTSYIIKESNPEDLRIKDYIADGLERLYESERIKKRLIDFEQNLWSY